MAEAPERRKVLLGITGSIAAYKSAELTRLLVSRGYEVRVVMTEAATRFITPLTLQAVSGFPVTTEFWTEEATGIGHIELADWADVLVIAPASADIIAKINAGICDEPLLAMALATKAPLLIAPAMNVNMYLHETTQANIKALRGRGVSFVDPEEGSLACGWNGTGRLAGADEIFFSIRKVLSEQDLKGKRILITTGPTREPLDPVRFISNRSSGKMGIALATEAFRRGAEVTLIHGPINQLKVPGAVRLIPVLTARDMHDAVMQEAFEVEKPPHILIMAAAVADFRSEVSATQKIKKSQQSMQLDLVQNPDILQQVGQRKADHGGPHLVGFAVETGEIDALLIELRRKLAAKNADIMVGNLAADALDLDTNRVWIIDRHGREEQVATSYKSRVARQILDAAIKL